MSAPRPSRIAAAAALWLIAVGAGSAVLLRYEMKPGADRAAPARWPAGSAIARSGDSPTLVMFVHPECPCTRASLGELARLLAQRPGPVRAFVLVLDDAGFPEDAGASSIWKTAAAIPGVTVLRDAAGAEARAFCGATSGRTLLYGAAGDLLFDGGITVARGHAGDNAGRSALVTLLQGGKPARAVTPVFGCPLFTSENP